MLSTNSQTFGTFLIDNVIICIVMYVVQIYIECLKYFFKTEIQAKNCHVVCIQTLQKKVMYPTNLNYSNNQLL